MNRFSIYQYLLILIVLVLGFTYALPNLYPTQPSIQVAYTDSGKSADQVLLNELEDILNTNDIGYEEIFLRENKIVIKFTTLDQQLDSKTVLQNNLLDKVIVALNLEPSTPDWLKDLGGKPVKLGLDLSGGVHFLLEVDIDTAQIGRAHGLNSSHTVISYAVFCLKKKKIKNTNKKKNKNEKKNKKNKIKNIK